MPAHRSLLREVIEVPQVPAAVLEAAAPGLTGSTRRLRDSIEAHELVTITLGIRTASWLGGELDCRSNSALANSLANWKKKIPAHPTLLGVLKTVIRR
jgi:hypothetical protein